MARLGERLRLSSESLTPLVKRMEKLGYVSRANATERNGVIIRLTMAGDKLQADVADVIGCVRSAVGLDDGQMSELMERLRSLRENLEAASELATTTRPSPRTKPATVKERTRRGLQSAGSDVSPARS